MTADEKTIDEWTFEQWWAKWNKCRCGFQDHARLSASNAWYRQAHRLERAEAKLALAEGRLEVARNILEGIYKRHLWTPGMGECICKHHIKAAEFLSQSDKIESGE